MSSFYDNYKTRSPDDDEFWHAPIVAPRPITDHIRTPFFSIDQVEAYVSRVRGQHSLADSEWWNMTEDLARQAYDRGDSVESAVSRRLQMIEFCSPHFLYHVGRCPVCEE